VIWEEEHKISYHTAFGLRTLHPINKTMWRWRVGWSPLKPEIHDNGLSC
jgi:hypothetical protein